VGRRGAALTRPAAPSAWQACCIERVRAVRSPAGRRNGSEWEGHVWKRDDEQPARQTPVSVSRVEMPRAAPARSGHATIGPSIMIRGEVTGNEDLIIQGQVDGSVTLDLHAVTVGDGGRVKAGIRGRVITVEGDVEGDLTAQEQIVLRGGARVQGDLKAPRVVLEDGATFRGLVDMGAAVDHDPEAIGVKNGAAPYKDAPVPET
jgi:cytoskeletal protein CcmA (bactofilin family)